MTERELVHKCRMTARKMGAYLAEVGQRDTRGAGSTKGFPDAVLVCSGHKEFVEFKAPGLGIKGLRPDQWEFIRRCGDQHVQVHVIDSEEAFIVLVNDCRRQKV